MKQLLTIIKVGGNIIDDDTKLMQVLNAFATVDGHKILVHGGGKLATQLAADLNIPQQMVDGRRITDEATLKIVTMVYAGLINKKIVASLNALHTPAIGLTGADANAIKAHKRIHASIDFGYVGDVDEVNSVFFNALLQQNLSIVVAPITQDQHGQLLNTNADTVAQEIAKALSSVFDVRLIYSFEKKGVLKDINDENSVISRLDVNTYQSLKNENLIFEGMIPKLDNAFAAIAAGVQKVIIGDGTCLGQLLEGSSGTTIA
jgi:acetylglutamate kinase